MIGLKKVPSALENQQLYKALGEGRMVGSLPTGYAYTGQYHEDYMELYWYNSRLLHYSTSWEIVALCSSIQAARLPIKPIQPVPPQSLPNRAITRSAWGYT